MRAIGDHDTELAMTKQSQPSNSPRSLILLAAISGSLLSGAAYGWQASGTVKNASGTALSGVVVTVKDSAASLTATTDATGNFTIGNGSSTGIETSAAPALFSAQVIGDALAIQCPKDGPLSLALVDASGRSLWNANVVANQGSARAALPAGLGHGAIFLRIRHASGVQYLAVSMGAAGMQVASPTAAARSQASTYPVLAFKATNYNDTTYAMTAASQTNIAVTMSSATTCPFPTTFKWKDNGGPIASPGNGWVAIKDFTNVVYNGQHIVYMSTHDNKNYGSAGMAPFTSWSDAATAVQTKMTTSTVAPELLYFTPKKQWILSYQWGSAKFNYMTSSDPTKANSWSGSKPLLTEDITKATYGPIDQVVICDSANCYLFYAADNGHIYRASMPIGNFPGNFSGSADILQDSQANLFEAVEVYTVKGTGKYLMIVECMGGGGRYFRAFSATSLGGTWTSISNASNENTPFAGKKNVTFTNAWTNDISHGDLVRGYDETRTVDPCNLQMLYQGYNPSFSGDYDLKPYKLGLLTFVK